MRFMPLLSKRIVPLCIALLLAAPVVAATLTANHAVVAPTSALHPTYDDLTADTGNLVISRSDVDHSTIRVGIGTTTPDSKLHVSATDLSVGGAATAHVVLGNAVDSISTTGLRVDSAPLAFRGGQTGVEATTSKTGGADAQRGSALGRLASSGGFFASGSFIGALGSASPLELSNFGPASTSLGLGGHFRAQPTAPLTLDATGTYWVGGVFGEVAGTIDVTPAAGAVAGVIGVDSSLGTARSYAGYFRGDVEVEGGFCVDDPGTAPACPAVLAPGAIVADGTITANAFDLAERFGTDDRLEPGDVVLASPTQPGRVVKAAEAASKRVVGIVSAQPGVILGWSDGQDAPIALAGRVLVKATTVGGPIEVGDLLVSAPVPGHAMASDAPAPGTVLGKALQALPAGEGLILVLVMLG